MSIEKIDREVAIFFAEQCAGTHEGQMAMVPNNPMLRGLMKAYGLTSGPGVDRGKFASFLRAVATELEASK